jgi:hypothetical protein
MKTILVVVGIGIVAYGNGLAQTTDVIRVKGGIGKEKNVRFVDRYRYDQFRDGKVLFHNGSAAAAKFNYNVLLGEMQFIDAKGDTLALANEPVVRLVGIDGPSSRQDLFMFDQTKGYMEVIADYGAAKLAVKQGLKTTKVERKSAYDQSSGASAITNYQFHSAGNASIAKLDTKGDLLLIKDRSYFFIDQNSRFHPANRASILKVFAKHRDQIATYLASESIDFNKEDDLKKLLNYCSDLT